MKTKFYSAVTAIMFFATLQTIAQTSLKMGTTGGPAGSGPSTSSQLVTLYENGTTAFSPAVTVTYSLSNQQFGAGTLESLPLNSAMNLGGTLNGSSNTIMGAQPFYGLMNAISSPLSTMFSACNTCGTSGIDVTTDRAISFFNCTEAFINPSTGVNTQALNARVYVGDITITFNRPVSNPVLQFVGMGGTTSITRSGKIYDMGFTTEFDLIGNNVTLNKLAGNTYLNVSTTQITNTATWLGANSQGAASNGITRYAANGSIVALGTNITSISLKAYVRGDGGRVNNGTSVVAADAGFTPLWAFGATNPFGSAGTVAGDLMLFGVSVTKPVTVSGNVFKDPSGGTVNNSSGTANNVPTGIFANLIDANGKVVAVVPVNTDGTYNLQAVFEGNYSVNISTTAGTPGTAAPASSLPAGWRATGEFNGAPDSGNDGNINGTSSSFTVALTNVTNINFAIQQPPVSPNQTYTIIQPSYNSVSTLNGSGAVSSPAPLNGSDAEDGSLGSGKTFSITVGAAMNGNKLFYNGVEITGTVSIPNYNPALLTVQYSAAGSTSLSFTYQSFDGAGQASNVATYNINWLMALPVQGFNTSVILNNGTTAFINWTTEAEQNTKMFYVERSTDNSTFTAIATIAAAGNSISTKNYNIQNDVTNVKGTAVYYRVKLVDADGKVTYSNAVVVRLAAVENVKVWPNPFVENISMGFYSETNTTVLVKLIDVQGKIITARPFKVLKGANQITIGNLKNQPVGVYVLQIEGGEGTFKYVQKMMK